VSRTAISVLVLLIIAVPCTRADAPTVRPSLPVDRLFDQYGRIRWDEEARLDNFAIQLTNEPDLMATFLFTTEIISAQERPRHERFERSDMLSSTAASNGIG
jgi:hypothetical protein